jgi:hypothetical protein
MQSMFVNADAIANLIRLLNFLSDQPAKLASTAVMFATMLPHLAPGWFS